MALLRLTRLRTIVSSRLCSSLSAPLELPPAATASDAVVVGATADDRASFFDSFGSLTLFHNATSSSSGRVVASIAKLGEMVDSLDYRELVSAAHGIAMVKKVGRVDADLCKDMTAKLSERALQLSFSQSDCVSTERLHRRLSIAVLFTLLDAVRDGKSVTATLVRKLGDKDALNSRRTFTKLDPESFVDFMLAVGATRSISSQFHRYYVFYKCYDMLDDLPERNLGVVFEAMVNHRIITSMKHPLSKPFAERLLHKIRNCSNSNQTLRPILMFLLSVLPHIPADDADEKLRCETILALTEKELSLELLCWVGVIAAGMRGVPDKYQEQLEARLLEDSDGVYLSGTACLQAVELMQSAWVTPTTREALVKWTCKSIIQHLRKKTGSQYHLVRSAATLAFLGVFDENVLTEVFSHPNLVQSKAAAGELLLAGKLHFSGDPKHFAVGRCVKVLSGLVDILRPEYAGPKLSHKPYPDARKENEEDDEKPFLTMSSATAVIRKEMRRKIPDRFLCETALLPQFRFTDFIFATNSNGELVDLVEFKDRLKIYSGLRDLPSDLRWHSVAIVESRIIHCRDLSLVDEVWSEGYRSKGFRTFAVDYRHLYYWDRDEASKLLEDFVAEAMDKLKMSHFQLGMTTLAVPRKQYVDDHVSSDSFE